MLPLVLAAPAVLAATVAAAAAEPTLRVLPAEVPATGAWVEVAFAGISEAEQRRTATEFVCAEDTVCRDTPGSLWVGAFPAGSDRRAIGPQPAWDYVANAPWLATSPLKWKPVSGSSGVARFRVESARAAVWDFALFSNGTTWPIELAAAQLRFVGHEAPRHVHLARVPSPTQMRVSWSSPARDPAARVRWGTAPGQYSWSDSAEISGYSKEDLCGPPATTHGWWQPPWFYSAVIGPFGTPTVEQIYYTVGSNSTGWTEERSFKVPKAASPSSLDFVVYGDLGETSVDGAQYHWMEAFAINTTTFAAAWHRKEFARGHHPQGRVVSALQRAAAVDLVLHIGDLSYATGYESKWDQLMSQIEPLAARAPYMTCQGNHERDWPGSGSAFDTRDSGGECGIPTSARFRMPTSSRTPGEDWYSFDQGPVHFLMMSTELPAWKGSPQWIFIDTDLSTVDRAKTPWVVFAGHRPMYTGATFNSSYNLYDGQWWPDVEELLVRHQVDLCFWGHVHNAEITCPMVKGRCQAPAEPGAYAGPVHAIVGNAGMNLIPFCLPTNLKCCCSSGGVQGPRCEEACRRLPEWSRWRMDSFGYAAVSVDGAKELTISFYEDCVGERVGFSMRACRQWNRLAANFTLRRGAGGGGGAARSQPALVV